jgi:hypothetical protein
MDAVRMATDDDATIEGWAVPFDGSFNDGRDSYGTMFSARTDFRLDWYSERPLLWHHGLDKDVGLTPVGTVRTMEVRDKGVWMKAQLDAQSEYFEAIRQMVKDGKVFLSSGSVEHLVQINQRTGHVDRWPIVEQTMTTTPSNLLADIPVASFRSALPDALPDGLTDADTITHTATRAVWSTADQNDFPDSSFAYVEDGEKDSDGKTTPRSKRHLPYKDADGKPDAAHVKAALSRLDQTDIPDNAKASARKKLLAAAKELGIETASATKSADVEAMRADPMDDDDDGDVGTDERSFEDICSDLDGLLNPMYSGAYTQRLDTFPTHVLVKRYEYGGDGYAPINDPNDGCTYWDIPYTIGANLEPVLGTPVQVERNESFTPVARAAELPFGFDAQLIQRHAATFARTTEEYGERRFREGRVLSGANMQTLSDTIDGMQTHVDTLRDLHKRASARQEEAARAALYADPEWVRVQLKLLELAAV